MAVLSQEVPARKRSSQATDSVSRWLVCRAAHISQQPQVCHVRLGASDMNRGPQLCFLEFGALRLCFSKFWNLKMRPGCAVLRHFFCLTT